MAPGEGGRGGRDVGLKQKKLFEERTMMVESASRVMSRAEPTISPRVRVRGLVSAEYLKLEEGYKHPRWIRRRDVVGVRVTNTRGFDLHQ